MTLRPPTEPPRWRRVGLPRAGGVLAVLALHGVAVAAWWLGLRAAPPAAAAPERVGQLVMLSWPVAAALPVPAAPAVPAPAPAHRAGRTVAPSTTPSLSVPAATRSSAPVGPSHDQPPLATAGAPGAGPQTSPAASQGGTTAVALAAPASVAAPVSHPPRALAGNPLPAYPEAAREDGLEGSVRLAVEVDALGHVTSVRWDRRSGVMLLDVAARDAVRQWRFEPARHAGQAVSATVAVTLQFRLDAPVRWLAQADSR